MNQLKQAQKYHETGLNVIPIRIPGEHYESKGKEHIATGKEPRIRWKEYQFRPQTRKELDKLFDQPDNNIAVLSGPVSKNLLILDHDDKDKYIDLHRKNSYFRHLADNTLSDRTRRGRHLWLFTDKPAKTSKNPELGIDLKGHRSYCVSPDSVWKHGRIQGRYLFTEMNEILQVQIEDLAFLGVEPLEHWDTDWLGLGYKYFLILQGETGGYKTRSDAECALVLNQISNGEPFEHIQEIFRRYTSTKTHYQEHKEPEKYLQLTYEKAQKYYLENQRDFDKQINHAMQTAKHLDFRTHSDPYVLLSILQKAKETGKLFLDLSVRNLAEMANLSISTVSNSLNRLAEAGFIHKELSGHYDHAARYAVNISSLLQKPNTPTQPCAAMVCSKIAINPEREIGKDVFTHYGLGKSGYKVIQILKGCEKLSIPEICRLTGLAYNTVKSKLKELPCEVLKDGRCSKYTLRLDQLDLDRIAERKGVAGRKNGLKKQHKVQRAGYQAYLLSKSEKKNNKKVG